MYKHTTYISLDVHVMNFMSFINIKSIKYINALAIHIYNMYYDEII